MANFTTTNVLPIAVQSYVEGQRAVPSGWRQVYDFTAESVPSMRLASISGVGEIPQWDGSSDLDIATMAELGSKSLDYVKYGLQVRIPKLDAADVPGLVEQAARKLGIATDSTYGTIAAAKLNGAFSTTTTADGKALIADDHTKRSGTRDNLTTSAFDRTALFTALALAANWESYEGLDYDLSELGWYLVYPGQSATPRRAATSRRSRGPRSTRPRVRTGSSSRRSRSRSSSGSARGRCRPSTSTRTTARTRSRSTSRWSVSAGRSRTASSARRPDRRYS
jgi:hypothetical protein